MGILWTWFMGKPESKLLAMKAKCERLIVKYQAKSNAIDLELAKRKSAK